MAKIRRLLPLLPPRKAGVTAQTRRNPPSVTAVTAVTASEDIRAHARVCEDIYLIEVTKVTLVTRLGKSRASAVTSAVTIPPHGNSAALSTGCAHA